jgi:integrase
MLPKLYHVKHPDCPWLVVFTEPSGKRRQRFFAKHATAKEYHKKLLEAAKVAGTAGLVMDAEARAEYFAAKRALGGASLMAAVRHFLKHRPVGLGATLLVEAGRQFLAEKRRIGRSEHTVYSLEVTIDKFLAESPARQCCDFTREAVTRYLDELAVRKNKKGKTARPGTIQNHLRRLSAFGGWLARRQFISENPVAFLERPTVDIRPPRVFSPAEAAKVMAKAVDYVGGTFAATFAIALFAGLRRGEIERLTWDSVTLDGDEPIIRVGAGKIRGRRAVRIVPVCDALLTWLLWARRRKLPLVKMSGNSAKVRKAVAWQSDICRHSWISCRLALVKDEAQVAREAGNSPDVIYRHYFQLVSEKDAEAYFAIFAPAKKNVRTVRML